MHFKEKFRSKSFWAIDLLKGRPVRRHYNNIQHILENPSDSKTKLHKSTSLNAILKHAVTTTNYYKKFKLAAISNFPVINKNTILENFNDFESNTFKESERLKITTSGSTGIPLQVWHDSNKKNRNTADTIYFSELANYHLGRTLVYIKLWDEKSNKNWITLFKQNIISHNVLDDSDSDIEQFLKKLINSRSQKTMIGYPSFFEQICKFLDHTDLNVKSANIKSIISIAETLSDNERNGMTKYFNTPIYNRYSNQENGIIAQQTLFSKDEYLVNSASYFVELLHPKKDIPIAAGEVGRIVVTDLYSYAMPLIRYDTGDMAISTDNGAEVHSLKELFGRRMDMIYDTEGNIVSPHIFYSVSKFSAHKQFQFIQDGKTTYTFRLNATKQQTEEQQIIKYFKTYLGENAQIAFNYVNEIPVLESGKRKKVKNNYFR